MYRTKYDLWILAILVAASVAGGYAAIAGFVEEPFPVNAISLGILGLLGASWWLVLTIRYEIAPPELIVRTGPFRFHIPIKGIRSVRRTMNPLSSPAASLDRLRIDYDIKGKKRWILISPNAREEFIDALRDAGAKF